MARVARKQGDQRGFISLAIFIVIAYGVLEVATINHARSAGAIAHLEERASINLLRYHKLALESGVTDGGFAAMGAWIGVPGELFGNDVVDLRMMLANRYPRMNLGTNCPSRSPLNDVIRDQYQPYLDRQFGGGDWKEKAASRIAAIPEIRLRFYSDDSPQPAVGGAPPPEPVPELTMNEIDLFPLLGFRTVRGYNLGCCDMELPDTNLNYSIEIQRLAEYAREAGKACGTARSLCAALEIGMCMLSDHVTLGPYGITRAHFFPEPCEGPADSETYEDAFKNTFGVYSKDTCSPITDPFDDNYIDGFFAEDPVTNRTYPRTWMMFSGYSQGSQGSNDIFTPCGACSTKWLFAWDFVPGDQVSEGIIADYLYTDLRQEWALLGLTFDSINNQHTINVTSTEGWAAFNLNDDEDDANLTLHDGTTIELEVRTLWTGDLIIWAELTTTPLNICHPCAYNPYVNATNVSTFREAEGVVMRSQCRFRTVFEEGYVGLFPTTLYDGVIELVNPDDDSMVTNLPIHIGVDPENFESYQQKCDFHMNDMDLWAFYDIACRMVETGFDPADEHNVTLPVGGNLTLEQVLRNNVTGKQGIHNLTATFHLWASHPEYKSAEYDRLVRCPSDMDCLLRVLQIYPMIRHSMETCTEGEGMEKVTRRCCP